MPNVTPIDPSQIPADTGGNGESMAAETGRLLAAKEGVAFQDPNAFAPMPLFEQAGPAPEGNEAMQVPELPPDIVPADEGKGRWSITMLPPDGRKITMGPPGHAIALVVCRILGVERSRDMVSQSYVRAMLYVREVDGKRVAQPASEPELQTLMNALGDTAVDACVSLYGTKWSPVTVGDLPLSVRSPKTTTSSSA